MSDDRPTTIDDTIDDWEAHRRADRERIRRIAAEMNTVVDELAPRRQQLHLHHEPEAVHRCYVQIKPDPDCPLHGDGDIERRVRPDRSHLPVLRQDVRHHDLHALG